MKFLQDKGILFKLLTFFVISLFIITPTAIQVMLGLAKIELNARFLGYVFRFKNFFSGTFT